MYQLFIKNIFTLLLILMCSLVFAQSSGTFKVTKQEPEEEQVKKKLFKGFSIATRATLAGKSSPKKVRDYNLMLGYIWHIGGQRKRLIDLGISLGKSNPSINYDGFAPGAFISCVSILHLGPTQVLFPIEISYHKLLNNLDFGNLNQYAISTGFSVHFPAIYGLHITSLIAYRIDSNSSTTHKGFYPTFGLDYYF